MPNFAHEFPFLMFMPMIIIAAVAAIAGFVHLAVAVDATRKSRRAAAPKPVSPVGKPVLVWPLDPQSLDDVLQVAFPVYLTEESAPPRDALAL